MGKPLGLGAYLRLASWAEGYAERKLHQRLEAGKEDPDRLDERRGIAAFDRPEGELIWFHAASIGESLSVLELFEHLVANTPDLHILITSGTPTSAKLLGNRLPPRAFHQYAPLDLPQYVNRFLDHWKPDLAIFVESELWPSMLHLTQARGIPMGLINARMSAKSAKGWRRARGMAGALLNSFDVVLAQDQITAGYLSKLGLAPDKLSVIGSLKESAKALPVDEEERKRFAAQLVNRPTWIAASTHEGEEEIVAEIHRRTSREVSRLLTIIAPRHPARGDEIAKDLRALGVTVAQRSKGERLEPDTDIYLADTIGEMGLWFRLATVTFLGGSLVPIGGHNPFEPAGVGSAIITGKYVTNFEDIFARLQEAEAVIVVKSAKGLGEALLEAFEPDRAAFMAHAAWEVLSESGDVLTKTLETVTQLLEKARR